MRRPLAALLILLAGPALAGPPISSNVAAPSGNTVVPSVPASIAGNAHFTSVCILAGQYRAFDVFAATAGAATLQVQRYADPSCAYVTGAAVPAAALALTAAGGCPGGTSCGDVGSNDGLPFLALKITLTDTSGSSNAVTTVTLTQGAE